MNHVPDVNRREPDYDRLLNLKALSKWTLDRQQEHAEDRATYERALASFQSYLRSQHIEGDGHWSAARRSKKVERHLKALVNASRKAQEAAEALRNSYATHVAQVAGLPAQREAKAIKKSGRRQAVGELTAKYRLSAELSLLSVLRLYLPRVVFAGTLAGKRREVPLALTWDPVERTGEPARCGRCDGLTYEVGLHGGGIACPRCLAAGDRSHRGAFSAS